MTVLVQRLAAVDGQGVENRGLYRSKIHVGCPRRRGTHWKLTAVLKLKCV